MQNLTWKWMTLRSGETIDVKLYWSESMGCWVTIPGAD